MFATLVKTLVLPPALQLLMMLFAFLLWRRRLLSRALLSLAWLSLLLLSLPVVSVRLYEWLEEPYFEVYLTTDRAKQDDEAELVVILGAGRLDKAPENSYQDHVSPATLWRLNYGVKLARERHLPILFSGGTVYPYEKQSEAQLAEQVLREGFLFGEDDNDLEKTVLETVSLETVSLENVSTENTVTEETLPEKTALEKVASKKIMLESNSRNTWENAHKTAQILKEKNIGNILLVTHAYHMRRAVLAFEAAGVTVVPMATGFRSTQNISWLNAWLPTASTLQQSRVALHEYIGLVVYSLKAI